MLRKFVLAWKMIIKELRTSISTYKKLLDVARQDMPETQEKQRIGQSILIDGGPSAVKTPNL